MAHVSTAGLAVTMLYLVGTLTLTGIPADVRLLICALAALGGVLVDIRAIALNRCTVSPRRQTAKRLAQSSIGTRHWWMTPLMWGIDTGLILTTYRVSFGTWVVLLGALLAVAPPWIGFVYGASFGLTLLASMFLGGVDTFGKPGSVWRAWGMRTVQFAGVAMLVTLSISIVGWNNAIV